MEKITDWGSQYQADIMQKPDDIDNLHPFYLMDNFWHLLPNALGLDIENNQWAWVVEGEITLGQLLTLKVYIN